MAGVQPVGQKSRQSQQEDAPEHGQQMEQVAPRRIKKNKEPDVPQLVTEMKDWFIVLERSVAAYNHLHLSLTSFLQQTPEGERKKGLPVFTFKASCDGVKAIDVVADIRKVAQHMPEYVQHVMIPLINIQAVDMIEAIEEIETRVTYLKPVLQQIMSGGHQQQQPVEEAAG